MENIKKKILKMVIGVICLGAAYCFSRYADSNISELATTNIEALAEGEELTGGHCFGGDTVDCCGRMVEMKIEGLSRNDYEKASSPYNRYSRSKQHVAVLSRFF